jgi:hypothetical protein
MALRPIDMTMSIKSAPELNRTQSHENAKPVIDQHQFADRFQRDVRLSDQQVTQTNKTDSNKVDRDGRGPGGGARQRKKKNEKNNAAAPKPKQNGSMLDVSV